MPSDMCVCEVGGGCGGGEGGGRLPRGPFSLPGFSSLVNLFGKKQLLQRSSIVSATYLPNRTVFSK